MNDVVNLNTGLYHDQSLFNLINTVKPLPAALCGVADFSMNSCFSKVNMLWEKKNVRMTKMVFFSKKNLRMTKICSQKFW